MKHAEMKDLTQGAQASCLGNPCSIDESTEAKVITPEQAQPA